MNTKVQTSTQNIQPSSMFTTKSLNMIKHNYIMRCTNINFNNFYNEIEMKRTYCDVIRQ